MNGETPSFLSVNLKDAKELSLAENGEYRLRIMAAEILKSQKGNFYINCRAAIPSRPATEQLYFPLFFPPEDADEFQKERSDSDLKKFAKAFGYNNPQGIFPNELIGLEGFAILGTDTFEGRSKNVVERFVSSPVGAIGGLAPPTPGIVTPPVPATPDDDDIPI